MPRTTSKPNHWLTGSSLRFRPVFTVLNNDNRPDPELDGTAGQPACGFWSRPKDKKSYSVWSLPARCSGVELRPCESLQLILSDVTSFCTRDRLPFLAASRRALSPLSRSSTSWSPCLTRSNGVWPSRFFLFGSAPCYEWRWYNHSISFRISDEVFEPHLNVEGLHQDTETGSIPIRQSSLGPKYKLRWWSQYFLNDQNVHMWLKAKWTIYITKTVQILITLLHRCLWTRKCTMGLIFNPQKSLGIINFKVSLGLNDWYLHSRAMLQNVNVFSVFQKCCNIDSWVAQKGKILISSDIHHLAYWPKLKHMLVTGVTRIPNYLGAEWWNHLEIPPLQVNLNIFTFRPTRCLRSLGDEYKFRFFYFP